MVDIENRKFFHVGANTVIRPTDNSLKIGSKSCFYSVFGLFCCLGKPLFPQTPFSTKSTRFSIPID